MKRFFAFLLLSMLISIGVMAQTRTRNVPFLPYAGATMREDLNNMQQGGGAIKASSNNRVIFFDRDSSDLREDQAKKRFILSPLYLKTF